MLDVSTQKHDTLIDKKHQKGKAIHGAICIFASFRSFESVGLSRYANFVLTDLEKPLTKGIIGNGEGKIK